MADLNARAGRGIALLFRRQVAIQVVTLGAGIVLARLLSPAEFGLFFIATFFVELVALAGNFGLAATFVQQRELSARELRVGFTLQQLVTTAAVVALVLAAPLLVSLYPDAPDDAVWLVRALALTLYLASWRSLSAVQLERRLEYRALALIEVVEALAYYGLAIALAASGLGVWSFVWAVLARGVLGALLAFAAAPFPLRPALDRPLARRILRDGLRFQAQTVTNQAASWITPVFVGSLIGPAAVGLLTWASSNARKPLLLVESATRVAFPHFARLQDDPREVERVLGRYLTLLLLPAGLWFAAVVVAAPSLVPIVYTEKWSPAVPALVLFAGALLVDVVSWVVGMSLNGVGRVGHVTRLTLARSVALMAAAVPLVLALGMNGVPLAHLLVGVVAIPFLLRGFGPGAARRLLAPLAWIVVPVAAGVAGGGLVLATPVDGLVRPLLALVAVSVAYAGAVWVVRPSELRASLRRARVAVPRVGWERA